jgi:Tol biopolymer transport system component
LGTKRISDQKKEHQKGKSAKFIQLIGFVVIVIFFLAVVIWFVLSEPKRVNKLEQIAFESYRDGNFEIYLMNLNGTNQRRLTFNDADDKDAKISHDNKWVVFTSLRDGNYEVYRIQIEDSQLTRLTNGEAFDVNPAMSYDNSQIIFVNGKEDNPDIYMTAGVELNVKKSYLS